ncbi:MAG: tRNA (guanosine(37)-N1)-methyltransferase TrmD [Blastocatellia bacterium]
MRFEVLTIFPDFFDGPLGHGIIRRALQQGKVGIGVHDLRSFTDDRHHIVDDRPFGGGDGMVLKPEPIFRGVESILALAEPGDQPGESAELSLGRTAVVLLSPQGRVFNQSEAGRLATSYSRLILICGRYEGVDERVVEHLVTEEISVGDYVLTGGEIPALVVIDAVTRLLPDVLGSETSAVNDSFAEGSDGLLDYPHFTRPAEFRGWRVPEVLVGGHHAQVARWRRRAALWKTWRCRPELLRTARLTEAERLWLEQLSVERDQLSAEKDARRVEKASDLP